VTAPLAVTLATRDYDYVAPLALGDVRPERIDLKLIRAFDALDQLRRNEHIHGGEASFSQYLQRVAAGDHSFVGLPVFVMREFRQRCFFVRRGSGMRDVADLGGRAVGTDAWAASGNTWSRAILRERSVPWEGIRWMVGPVDTGDAVRPGAPLPAGVEAAPPGRSLSDLLLGGDLDALMCPWPPRAFHQPDAAVVRLYPDYRTVEREYFRRTRLFPAHHLIVLRRALVDEHPWVVASLFRAFVESRARSTANRRMLHESSPWILADLEEQDALMGPEYRADGVHANRAMIAAFCEEQFAQRLIEKPIAPQTLFADFERVGGESSGGAGAEG
jgi:4,5-dihydroxyphthalate decarboxylase